MADYEVSKLMWMAIVISLAASVFIVAKPNVQAESQRVLDKVEEVVKSIKLPGTSNDTPSTNPDDYKEVSTYATNGTFAMDENGNGVLWATDKTNPIVVDGGVLSHTEGDNALVGKTMRNNNLKTLTIVSPMKMSGSMTMYFSQNPELTQIKGLDKMDVSEVTDLSYAFTVLPKLKSLDVSGWNTSKVTNFTSTFAAGVSLDSSAARKSDLTSLKLGKMNTSNGTTFTNVFGSLTSLTAFDDYKYLDFSKTNGGLSLSSLFSDTALDSIDFTNVKLPATVDFGITFAGMPQLKSFKLGQAVTVSSMNTMFVNSPKIETVDMSQANVDNVTKNSAQIAFADNNLKLLNVPFTYEISEGLEANGKIPQPVLDAYNAQNNP